jgi:hypothetical protein
VSSRSRVNSTVRRFARYNTQDCGERKKTMADSWATIVAALIGAGVGSLGTKIYENFSRRSAEKEQLRQEVVGRYLLQLQDAVDDLWYRLDNLKNPKGADQIKMEYFQISTLYALGKVLAYDRILLLEGIYPQFERLHLGEATELRKRLRNLDQQLNRRHFYRYDRLALAESVFEQTKGYLGTSTYLEFKRRYGADPLEGDSLASAKQYVVAATNEERSELQNTLRKIADQVARLTGLPSTINSRAEQ